MSGKAGADTRWSGVAVKNSPLYDGFLGMLDHNSALD